MPFNARTLNSAPLAEGSSEQETIDVPALVERCMGDPSLASQLLLLFQQRMPTTVQQIEATVSRGDVARAAALAHGLKGEAGNMGVTHLHRAASELERLLKSGASADASATMASLRSAAQDFVYALPMALNCLIGEEQATSST